MRDVQRGPAHRELLPSRELLLRREVLLPPQGPPLPAALVVLEDRRDLVAHGFLWDPVVGIGRPERACSRSLASLKNA